MTRWVALAAALSLLQLPCSVAAPGTKERITPAMAVRDMPTLIEFLDEYEADVEDLTGQTVLHWAASVGAADAIDYAIDQGGHVDKGDHEGRTPMHIAALSGHVEIIRRLLQKGAHPGIWDASGATPLHRAALSGIEDCVALLAQAAPQQVDQRQQRTDGTALHAAAYLGHTNVIKTLLEAGASPCLRDRKGRLPINRWVEEDHDLVAQVAEESPVVDEENRKDVISLLREGSLACENADYNYQDL